MIRNMACISFRSLNKGCRPAPVQAAIPPVVVTAEQIALQAALQEQARQIVRASLAQLRDRAAHASQQTPALEPYLDTYVAAASQSLVQHAAVVLEDHATAQALPCKDSPFSSHRWQAVVSRLPLFRASPRTEASDDPA